MLKNNILAIVMVLILSACASEKPVLTGVDGSAIPPAFAHFPDVPFPDQSYIDLEETKALGTGYNWIGSLAFTTPYNASSVFDFYMSVCNLFPITAILYTRFPPLSTLYFDFLTFFYKTHHVTSI